MTNPTLTTLRRAYWRWAEAPERPSATVDSMLLALADALPSPQNSARVAVAMSPMPREPGACEPGVLVAFNDGTFWEVGAEHYGWIQIEGPPGVPTVTATVEGVDRG